jgi:hypothetical protein
MSLPDEIEWIIYDRADTITKLKMHKAFPTKFPEPFVFPEIKKVCKYSNPKHKTVIWIDITPTKHYQIVIYGLGRPFGTRTHMFLVENDDLLGEWVSDDADMIKKGTRFRTLFMRQNKTVEKYLQYLAS